MISSLSPRSAPVVYAAFALFLVLVWVCQTVLLWGCTSLIFGICHCWIMMSLNSPYYIEAPAMPAMILMCVRFWFSGCVD